MEQQPLTREVFAISNRFRRSTQFAEHADTLLSQIEISLAHKPVCRFVAPPLDHEVRKKIMSLLPGTNRTLILCDSVLVHDDTPFHFTKVILHNG